MTEAVRWRDLTTQQWKTGVAAWLGWLFDTFDQQLFIVARAPAMRNLMAPAASTTDEAVREKSSWIQAAFLVGWALGGGCFGRIGDLLGRSRTLSLTILTYAGFTGLSFLAQTWWQLLIFRFMAALGIGGEWAVGASLLSETWPRRWRPWIAAVLQTGVNIGVLGACLVTYLLAQYPSRYVFLAGVLPALLVFWIRRSVPEPVEWHEARNRQQAPRAIELFRGEVRKTTVLTIVVCACSLTAWWAFMFWNTQHLRNLPEVASWSEEARRKFTTAAFFLVIGVSIGGNFFAGWLARLLGYRRSLVLLFGGFFLSMFGAFCVPRDHHSLLVWIAAVGFFSGVFGLFTMYLPPLFPTLLRTTGAGFCYNIGRIAAAAGTVFFGLFSQVGDFRRALLWTSLLLLPAMVVAFFMPDIPMAGDGAGNSTGLPAEDRH
ncbi:MAG: MFS transporter [Verrucomicrobia bacterium]|nr:MFS transporter [Verrucomicrobiota bacterium]